MTYSRRILSSHTGERVFFTTFVLCKVLPTETSTKRLGSLECLMPGLQTTASARITVECKSKIRETVP
jgi:hypothetical protein